MYETSIHDRLESLKHLGAIWQPFAEYSCRVTIKNYRRKEFTVTVYWNGGSGNFFDALRSQVGSDWTVMYKNEQYPGVPQGVHRLQDKIEAEPLDQRQGLVLTMTYSQY